MRKKSQRTELNEATRAARPRHCLSNCAAILTGARLPVELAVSTAKRSAGITAYALTIAAVIGAILRCGEHFSADALGAVEKVPAAAPTRASS